MLYITEKRLIEHLLEEIKITDYQYTITKLLSVSELIDIYKYIVELKHGKDNKIKIKFDFPEDMDHQINLIQYSLDYRDSSYGLENRKMVIYRYMACITEYLDPNRLQYVIEFFTVVLKILYRENNLENNFEDTTYRYMYDAIRHNIIRSKIIGEPYSLDGIGNWLYRNYSFRR